jgi:hypothetical protein
MSDIGAITYQSGIAVTLSDTTPSPRVVYAAFYVGVTGDVQITDANGNTFVMPNCQQGTIYPIAATKYWLTNTTASKLIALSAQPYSVIGGPQ